MLSSFLDGAMNIVKALQDDITPKTVPIWLHHTACVCCHHHLNREALYLHCVMQSDGNSLCGDVVSVSLAWHIGMKNAFKAKDMKSK